jgi:hypothetical protein
MTGGPGRKGRARPRSILRLIVASVLLLALAPAYAAYGVFASGRLALAQQAPASEILRGFDFGPVWLEQGETGRYYITATLPQSETATWNTTFEVLNLDRQPVFRENEVRFIGDYMFRPGQRDRTYRQFKLQKGTGYYYFRFKANNGIFDANPGAMPVVQFAIRQRVLHGWALWGPAAGLLLLGLLAAGRALVLISRLGTARAEAPQREPRRAVQRPAAVQN